MRDCARYNRNATRVYNLQEGTKGVEAQYMQSKEFHEAWKVQARDMLARSEFKKRKLTQRVSFGLLGTIFK